MSDSSSKTAALPVADKPDQVVIDGNHLGPGMMTIAVNGRPAQRVVRVNPLDPEQLGLSAPVAKLQRAALDAGQKPPERLWVSTDRVGFFVLSDEPVKVARDSLPDGVVIDETSTPFIEGRPSVLDM